MVTQRDNGEQFKWTQQTHDDDDDKYNEPRLIWWGVTTGKMFKCNFTFEYQTDYTKFEQRTQKMIFLYVFIRC